jgi:hypothetical protein
VSLFLVGERRTFEVLEYDPKTHRALLRNEKGEEVVDPNFWIEMVKRVYRLEQREE